MSDLIPTTSVTSTTSATTATTTAAAKSSSQALDKNTFLKLLIAQVSHQDPMSPTDSTQWMAQMAQFSTVEQLTNMAQTTTDTQRDTQNGNAVALLGRDVTYTDSAGNAVSGTVEQVDITTSSPTLTIAGQAGIAPSALINVR
jgi:flagellar basal-body rod modification protein FlgD